MAEELFGWACDRVSFIFLISDAQCAQINAPHLLYDAVGIRHCEDCEGDDRLRCLVLGSILILQYEFQFQSQEYACG